MVVHSGNYVGPILCAADNLVIKGTFAIKAGFHTRLFLE